MEENPTDEGTKDMHQADLNQNLTTCYEPASFIPNSTPFFCDKATDNDIDPHDLSSTNNDSGVQDCDNHSFLGCNVALCDRTVVVLDICDNKVTDGNDCCSADCIPNNNDSIFTCDNSENQSLRDNSEFKEITDDDSTDSATKQEQITLCSNGQLQTGRRIRETLQKGREFLKRKLSFYQLQWKSRWDKPVDQSNASFHSDNGCNASTSGGVAKQPLLHDASGFDVRTSLQDQNNAALISNEIHSISSDQTKPSSCIPCVENISQSNDKMTKSVNGQQDMTQRDAEADADKNPPDQDMASSLPVEDDVPLGGEAIVMSSPAVNGMRGMALDQHNREAINKERRLPLLPLDSFQSDATQTSISTVSSIEALLEGRQIDPERVLMNLGFGSLDTQSLLERIPLRFLHSQSSANGMGFNALLSNNSDLCHLANMVNPDIGMGTRSAESEGGVARSDHFSNASHGILLAQSFVTMLQNSSTAAHANKISRLSQMPIASKAQGSGSGTASRSILHPDNQKALALRGHYNTDTIGGDNIATADVDSSVSHENNVQKVFERFKMNANSAQDRRKMFRDRKFKHDWGTSSVVDGSEEIPNSDTSSYPYGQSIGSSLSSWTKSDDNSDSQTRTPLEKEWQVSSKSVMMRVAERSLSDDDYEMKVRNLSSTQAIQNCNSENILTNKVIKNQSFQKAHGVLKKWSSFDDDASSKMKVAKKLGSMKSVSFDESCFPGGAYSNAEDTGMMTELHEDSYSLLQQKTLTPQKTEEQFSFDEYDILGNIVQPKKSVSETSSFPSSSIGSDSVFEGNMDNFAKLVSQKLLSQKIIRLARSKDLIEPEQNTDFYEYGSRCYSRDDSEHASDDQNSNTSDVTPMTRSALGFSYSFGPCPSKMNSTTTTSFYLHDDDNLSINRDNEANNSYEDTHISAKYSNSISLQTYGNDNVNLHMNRSNNLHNNQNIYSENVHISESCTHSDKTFSNNLTTDDNSNITSAPNFNVSSNNGDIQGQRSPSYRSRNALHSINLDSDSTKAGSDNNTCNGFENEGNSDYRLKSVLNNDHVISDAIEKHDSSVIRSIVLDRESINDVCKADEPHHGKDVLSRGMTRRYLRDVGKYGAMATEADQEVDLFVVAEENQVLNSCKTESAADRSRVKALAMVHTGSAQSDSSGFADAEGSDTLAVSQLGSSGESDATSSTHTVRLRNLEMTSQSVNMLQKLSQDSRFMSNDSYQLSSCDRSFMSSGSFGKSIRTEDKGVNTDMCGVDGELCISAPDIKYRSYASDEAQTDITCVELADGDSLSLKYASSLSNIEQVNLSSNHQSNISDSFHDAKLSHSMDVLHTSKQGHLSRHGQELNNSKSRAFIGKAKSENDVSGLFSKRTRSKPSLAEKFQNLTKSVVKFIVPIGERTSHLSKVPDNTIDRRERKTKRRSLSLGQHKDSEQQSIIRQRSANIQKLDQSFNKLQDLVNDSTNSVLPEEGDRMEQAAEKYCLDLHSLESSFTAQYSKVSDFLSDQDRCDLDELNALRTEVEKEARGMERMVAERVASIIGSQVMTNPLSTMNLVNQMIELLKEQTRQKSLLLELENNINLSCADHSSSSFVSISLHNSKHSRTSDSSDRDCHDAIGTRDPDQSVQEMKHEIRKQTMIQNHEMQKSFNELKNSLLEEIRQELQGNTHWYQQQLKQKETELLYLHAELSHVRNQSGESGTSFSSEVTSIYDTTL